MERIGRWGLYKFASAVWGAKGSEADPDAQCYCKDHCYVRNISGVYEEYLTTVKNLLWRFYFSKNHYSKIVVSIDLDF